VSTYQGKNRKSPIKHKIVRPLSDIVSPCNLLSKSTRKEKVNLKDIPNKFLHRVRPVTRLQNEIATTQYLNQSINRGFNPKWYIVFHLHNPPYSYEDSRFEDNLRVIRNLTFGLIYGSNWRRKSIKNRARAIWGIELGVNRDRPHINLLIEDLSPKYSRIKDLEDLFNIKLPRKVKNVWMKSADIQTYYSYKLHGYISKEHHLEFPSINYHISDHFL